ncbi:amidase signature enzyme [Lindgomyces ingoldianus]|uniref:Amidase signature enzyme n=1 Tax=Lindgomyces ingoldianus TaxID=673940 RepID=A0ACB6R3I1_9PLEO|nr:amidase signature enzyme [Lindgomyces ingoldianus]KAF2473067.1 amidase signature enzyme [Lindgomyces ingoldianus]
MSRLPSYYKCLAKQSRIAHLNAFISLADGASVISTTPDTHGSFSGKSIAIKDNICTSDLPTTAGSGILKDFISPYDATVVRRLQDAGAVIMGKTNMDEFGMGSHSMHSYFGPVKQLGRGEEGISAGGSSGGSAVAVKSGYCDVALGTDTGGSVRLPAAYTGIVGFKPSYGLLSRWGVIAYANSLDTVGILANSVDMVRQTFNLLNKYDPQDPTSLVPSTRSRLRTPKSAETPLRIGIPLEYNVSTLKPAIRDAWICALRLLQSKGHTLHSVSLPATRHALSAYYILAPAEASSNLAKYDGVRYGSRAEGIDGTPQSVLFAKTRGEGFGPEVRRRILLGTFSLSAQAIDNYFIQAQKIRRLVQQDFDNAFSAPNPLVSSTSPSVSNSSGVDVLLCPTAPTLPQLISNIENQDSVSETMSDVFTVPASLAGLPAISIPISIREDHNDPDLSKAGVEQTAGMQIIGQYGDDRLVLDVASQLEVRQRVKI